MKKIVVVFIILILCIFLTNIPSNSKNSKRDETILLINSNSNVPFTLTQPESALKNINEYTMINGFGGYILENNDLSIKVSGYPDCLDKYHVTGYEIKSSRYTFMGLQVGCSLEELEGVMKKYGFTSSIENSWEEQYTKNGVSIGVSLNGNIVTIFHVSVEVTNKQEISF